MLKAVRKRAPWVQRAFVDWGYAGDETVRAAFGASRILRLEVLKRTAKKTKGFIILPKRWIVERTFRWMNRARRLAKDFETLVESSHAWFLLEITVLLIGRIARNFRATAGFRVRISAQSVS